MNLALFASLICSAALAQPALSLELEPFSSEAAARRAAEEAGKQLKLSVVKRGEVLISDSPFLEGPVVQVYRAGKKDWRVSVWVGAREDLPAVRQLLGGANTLRERLLRRDLNGDAQMIAAEVHVLWKDSSYPGAVERAKRAAAVLRRPYTTRGQVWDSAKGLVTRDDSDDEAYRGLYYPRRGNDCEEGEECVSVEPARAFGGPEGEFWVVGALSSGDASNTAVAHRLGRSERKPFWLYVGCMH